MAKIITIPNSVVPLDTQRAASEIGCNTNTLRNYIRAGHVKPPRMKSGRLCWFDQEIEQARKIYERNTQRG